MHSHSTSMYQHDEHIRAREMSSCKSLDVEEKHVVVGIVVYISMPPLCQNCLYLLFFLFLLFLSTCLVRISCVQTCSHHGHLGKPLYQQMASKMALQTYASIWQYEQTSSTSNGNPVRSSICPMIHDGLIMTNRQLSYNIWFESSQRGPSCLASDSRRR